MIVNGCYGGIRMSRIDDLEDRVKVLELRLNEQDRLVKIKECMNESNKLFKNYWDFKMRLDRVRRENERDGLTDHDREWFDNMKVEEGRLKGIYAVKHSELMGLKGAEILA